MAPSNPMDNVDMPNPGDPSEIIDGLEPEVVDGPLGLPVLKPKGVDGPDGLEDPMQKMGRY